MSSEGTRWQDLPLGGIIPQAGNACEYETGGWRSFRPIINREKTAEKKACTSCLTCWVFCPEASIIVEDSKMVGVDLAHCKGCGLCAEQCPAQCITMVEESQFQEEGK